MITYELYCRIQDGHARQGLTVAQIARALGLHEQTVVKWLACEQFHPRQSAPRSRDVYKRQAWMPASRLSTNMVCNSG